MGTTRYYLTFFFGLFFLNTTSQQPHRFVLSSGNFTVTSYRISIEADPAVRYIRANVMAGIIITEDTRSIIWDFTYKLKVDSVLCSGKKIKFLQQANNTLTLFFEESLAKNKPQLVITFYKGVPPVSRSADNSFGYSFIINKHKGQPVLFVVNEPYGTSAWMPCRNGLDDKADSIDFIITHPKKYTSSANGKLVSRIENGEKARTHFSHRYPVATYLMAFAISNYSSFGKTINIGNTKQEYIFYTYPEDEKKFAKIEDSLAIAIELCSKLFGNYPYAGEPYIQTQVSGAGGMEHQGNSFVDDANVNLQNHELMHQWFGNKVSCSGWSHIWLKEGAAVLYADFLYPFYTGNISQYMQNVNEALLFTTSKPDGQVWVKDSTNIERLFNSRLSYVKGAFIYRMLQHTLGDSAFFNGLKKYLNNHQYHYAGTLDMQRCMEETYGNDLSYFFKQWVYGQGQPSFNLQWNQQQADGKMIIKLLQTTSHASVSIFKMPLPVLLKGKGMEKVINIECNKKEIFIEIESPGFEVKEMIIDPEKWMITGKNMVVKNKLLKLPQTKNGN